MDRLTQFPPSIRIYFGDFLTRWRRVVALRAVGTSLALLAIWMVCACAIDRYLPLPGQLRFSLLLAGSCSALVVGVYRLRPLRASVDWVAVAGRIERHDPRFGQSLVTVTSRVLGSPEHRGSDEILSHLLREVELRAADAKRNKLLSLGSAAAPWAIFLFVATVVAILAQVPGLGGGQLLARLISPLSDVPPVTTTELRMIGRGDVDLLQSEPLRIEVEAHRLGNSPLWLSLNDDGVNWTRYAMDEAGSGRFAFALASVSRDFHYKISGGDATSPQYSVRVKRPPAVAKFGLRYTFPAYTGKPPLTLTNTDGAIEAPVGTEVVMTVVATEPLQSALLTVGDQKLLMDRTDKENVRRAAVRIQRDAGYELDLISTREVRGSGPGKMTIHATADHPPLVRLLQGGQTLLLNPRDVIPISYQVMDDYGLESISVVSQVNGLSPVKVPVRLHGDRRRQEEAANFDMASLPVVIGDVLTITISARDTAGQETSSEELRVLICPRPIDLTAYQRIDELNAGTNLTSIIAEELDNAAKALSEIEKRADHQSPPFLSGSSACSRHLTGASETAALLRQTLLRAAARSNSPDLSVALSVWTDTAQQEAFLANDLFRRAGSPQGIGDNARSRLQQAVDKARNLNAEVKTVWQSERAATVLADRINLQTLQKKPAPTDPQTADRRAQILQHADAEISAGAAELGVDLKTSDVDAQLRNRVEAGMRLMRSKQPTDFAALAREWSQELQREPRQPTQLEQRLAIAAQVEAVRKDADLICARDLELSARAIASTELLISQTPSGKPVAPSQLNTLNALANAAGELQREHVLLHKPAGTVNPDEMRVARIAAARARNEMARWAGETHPTKTAVAIAATKPGAFESLALHASAEAARHDYKRVAELDRTLAQELSDAARKPGGRSLDSDASIATTQMVEDRLQQIEHATEAVARHMTTAESVDRLGQTQEKLIQESRAAKNASKDLALRQRGVAEQIATVERQQADNSLTTTEPAHDLDDANWRGRATATLLKAQEELAVMPQKLALAQEAATVHRKAVERAEAAMREVTAAPPDSRPMAVRAAEQADHDSQDSASQLDKAMAPFSTQIVSDLSDRLEPFSPEAFPAQEIVRGDLAAALSNLKSSSQGKDPDAVSRAAGDVLKAVDAIQRELVRAQDSFTERDPLMAAQWFARAAADSLAHYPNDLRTALTHQANSSLALSRAWDRSVHRAAELRLSVVPSLQSVYTPSKPGGLGATAITTLSPNKSGRDWGRLHPREVDDLSATMHDAEPPGYEEPLRLYFEAIGKAQEKPK